MVDRTVRPCSFAGTAAATPIDDVPPRIRIVCPARMSSPVYSEPCAVCSIFGSAPSVAQSSLKRTGITEDAGTTVYSA
ncbi:hypothetical protein BS329_32430 [Amycolatopsis coloradensis]|uniref:Uncharacterized protein n=1 Tax=Amycolatopsis coloradensis TaxID=76021 RepID=A0A1R0KIV7_9PSEU|nr:hypothetical protein BS329_32430 [Amycolatopsis coloradensis]